MIIEHTRLPKILWEDDHININRSINNKLKMKINNLSILKFEMS
jgi:hypothetical protein